MPVAQTWEKLGSLVTRLETWLFSTWGPRYQYVASSPGVHLQSSRPEGEEGAWTISGGLLWVILGVAQSLVHTTRCPELCSMPHLSAGGCEIHTAVFPETGEHE